MEYYKTKEELIQAEINMIAFLRAAGCNLTNATDGGEGGATRLGQPVSKETREKMSKSRKGKKHKPIAYEARKNMNIDKKGETALQ